MEALILLNTIPGKELDVLERIASVPGVKVAFMVYGTYDIAVWVTASSMQKLKQLVSDYIRRMEGVLSTTTLVVAEKKVVESQPYNG